MARLTLKLLNEQLEDLEKRIASLEEVREVFSKSVAGVNKEAPTSTTNPEASVGRVKYYTRSLTRQQVGWLKRESERYTSQGLNCVINGGGLWVAFNKSQPNRLSCVIDLLKKG